MPGTAARGSMGDARPRRPSARGAGGLIGAALLLLLTAACIPHPTPRPLPQHGSAPVPIVVDPHTGQHSATVSVLIYNVAGLPWPVRSGTGTAIKRIARAFEERLEPAPPNFLLLQEAFIPRASRLYAKAGYSNFVRGPKRGATQTLEIAGPDKRFLAARRFGKGERLGKITNSGLVLATNQTIATATIEPFGPNSCAGFDCLSNKGMMLVEVDIPGMPEPLFILNTHLNSRGASGVPDARSVKAHKQQVREMEALLARDWRGRGPLIYAGDFNARNAPDRFDHKEAHLPGVWAHRFCHARRDLCDVRMSWDRDDPWLDTQDLQGYARGQRVGIRPILIQAMFDDPVDGKMLSDHDALLVAYRLTWRPPPTQRGRQDNPPPPPQ